MAAVSLKHKVSFDKIMTPKFDIEVKLRIVLPGREISVGHNGIENLLTYDRDIRKVFNDLLLKNIIKDEDKKFMQAVDNIVDIK